MKQRFFLPLTVLLLFLLVLLPGCQSNPTLTLEQAQQAALEHAGYTEEQVTMLSASLEDKEYEVAFWVDGVTYEYEVSAKNGNITSVTQEATVSGLLGDSPGDDNQSSQTEDTKQGQSTLAGEVSLQQARDIAIAYAGMKPDAVTIEKEQEDTEDGREIYEITFSYDTYLFAAEIEKNTGNILAFEYDFTDRQALGGTEDIGMDKASEKALAQVAGATEQELTIRSERDDGRLEYKGKILHDGSVYEFEIDASSGIITEWQEEHR